MTYSTGGLIQASDFNDIIGSYSLPNLGNSINAIWGTGFSNAGYGQSQLTNVTEDELITYDDWSNLIKVMNTAAYYQNTSITTYVPPVQYDKITYLSKLISNKNTLYSNRNYARQHGSTYIAPTTTVSNVWSDSAVFTHNIMFQSADKARYFFNAGGQIVITLSHTNGAAVNSMWHELATNAGSIVISGSLPDTINTIAGTNYTGITRVGGSGAATVDVNRGYYTLSNDYVEIFRKNAFAVFSSYLGSYVSMELKSNGTQGTNGDRGSILTIKTTWNEVPNGSISSATTGVTVAIRYPFSTSVPITNYPVPFLNTWGTVTTNGSVISE
jgi:hypothetical protein